MFFVCLWDLIKLMVKYGKIKNNMNKFFTIHDLSKEERPREKFISKSVNRYIGTGWIKVSKANQWKIMQKRP